MKQYNPFTPTVVRVELIQRGSTSKTISLDTDNVAEVVKWLKNIFSRQYTKTFTPLQPEYAKLSVQCFKANSQKKEKHMSFTIYGLTAIEALNFIKENLTD